MSKNRNDDSNLEKLILDKLQTIEVKFDKVEAKIDKLDDRIDGVDRTLVRNTENLAEHMRRTALIEEELKPIKRHVVMFEGALKFVGVIGLVIGIAVGIAKLIGAISGS